MPSATRLKCPKCGKEIHRNHFKTHLKIHNKEFKCDLCPYSTTSEELLNTHIVRKHSDILLDGNSGPSEAPAPLNDSKETLEKIAEDDKRLLECLKPNQHFLRKSVLKQKHQQIFNFPLLEGTHEEVSGFVKEVFHQLPSTCKINLSFGYVLRNIDENVGDRYFYAHNNNAVFSEPVVLRDEADLNFIIEELEGENFVEVASADRPNTAWKLHKLTNVTVFATLLHHIPLADASTIPQFLRDNRNIVTFSRHPFNKKPIQDSLCAFRAIAYHKVYTGVLPRSDFNSNVSETFSSFLRKKDMKASSFRGVKVDDIGILEDITNVNIVIYDCELVENQIIGKLVRRSLLSKGPPATLIRSDKHLCYVTKPKSVFHNYRCIHCSTFFKFPSFLERHQKTCLGVTTNVYPGGVYELPKSVFEELEELNIIVPESERFYKHFGVFDFESITDPENVPPNSATTTWIGSHIPLSVAYCSTVSDKPSFVCKEEPSILIKGFLDIVTMDSIKVGEAMLDIHTPYFDQLDSHIDTLEVEINMKVTEKESDKYGGIYSEYSFDTDKEKKRQLSQFKSLRQRYLQYVTSFPVFGFNSSRYDLNLIKYWLIPELVECRKSKIDVIKKTNQFLSLQFDQIVFLDILNFLGGCTTLDKFLKAYGSTEAKGFFPYEWLKGHFQLGINQLPSLGAFYSSLKGVNMLEADHLHYKNLLKTGLSTEQALRKMSIRSVPLTLEENYNYLITVWNEQKTTNMMDFLRWYNLKDVQPLKEAIHKMVQFYHTKGVDMLKAGLSLPCLSNRILHKSAPNLFYRFDEYDSNLAELVRENVVGGPSIVFTRIAQADETFIRESANMCDIVVGIDCNQLYPYAMEQHMPTGPPIRYDYDEVLKCLKRRRYHRSDLEKQIIGYLQTQHKECMIISLHTHGYQKKIGSYFVDGFCSHCNTVHEVMGCYFHFCECLDALWGGDVEEKKEKKRAYDKTRMKYLENKGYNVRIHKECDWKKKVKEEKKISEYVTNNHPRKSFTLTKNQLLGRIRNGNIFGVIECDLIVPDNLKEYFKNFPPIFKNCFVSRDDIGAFMKEIAEEQQLLKRPTKMLISSFCLQKGLVITPLLKFYMEKGLEVTHVYQFVEYVPKVCFKPFVDSVVEARREGDRNPDSNVIAETMKLVGNSSYGYQIMNRGKHSNTSYYDDCTINSAINSKKFRSYDEVTEGIYEVVSGKPRIIHKEPTIIGFFILQYAKLRMLELYYNFFKEFCDENLYEEIEMDTDSLYLALGRDSLDKIIRPEKMDIWKTARSNDCSEQFRPDAKFNFFPRDCCAKHKEHDKRTPGLFKEEFRGTTVVALCSKTYCVYDKETDVSKFSCKGLNKAPLSTDLTVPPLEKYLKVFEEKQSLSSLNRGFKFYNGLMQTYSQFKRGLSYFYPKRIVHADGVHTDPLNI